MRLPTPDEVKDPETRSYLMRLVKALTGAQSQAAGGNTAVASVLLASPNGSVYNVTVTDAGVIETELKYQAT